MISKLEQEVIEALADRNQSISCAESCTGGLLSHKLTNIPGSSQVFLGSVITYSNFSKLTLLKISDALTKSKGAVHNDIAVEMAKKVRKLFNSDYGIGITGIAGPKGGTKLKPVGLVFIALSTKFDTLCLKCQFEGNRLQIKTQAANEALKLLLEFL